MKSIFTCLLFFGFTNAFLAQNNFNIFGSVLDENRNKILEGEVYLLKDNLLIKSELILNGKFQLDAILENNYTLQIVNKGYKVFEFEIQLKKNETLEFILLKEDAVNLKEVTLISNRKTFTNSNGNIKVDVENSIFKAIPNPLDLLARLPGIQISTDRQSVSVVGRGNSIIYIDNQRASIEDLNSLSNEDIKTIEILKNPSSKYEADGRAIILITRKLTKKEGFEAVFSEVASFKKRFNNYLGTNLSFKKNKLEIKANFNYNNLNPWESIGNDFDIPNNNIKTNFLAESYDYRTQLIAGTSLFYQINSDDYLTFKVNGRIVNIDGLNTTNSFISQNNTNNFIETYNKYMDQRDFFNTLFNYQKNIKSLGVKLFTGLQYSNFYQKVNSIIENNYDNTNFELTQNRNQNFKVDVFSARTDLEKTFKNEIKLEIGALYLAAAAKTNFEVIDFISNNNENSNYNFKEKNTAIYSQITGKFKKVNYIIGLRAENTNIKGENKLNASLNIDKNYTNLFPKVQLDFPIDSTKTLSFNYAKSITRPNYSSTSQVSVYANPFLLFSRNINLNPTITDEISGTFQYLNKSVKLNFHQSLDPVNFVFSYNSSNNLITFNSINYQKELGVNLEFTLPFEYQSWNSTTVLNFIQNKIEDQSAVFIESKPYLYYSSNHTFKLPKKIDFAITGWGFTHRKEGVFDRNALFIMNMSLSKKFFTHWDCTLSYNDIFRNLNFHENFTINNITSRGIYYTDTHEFSISIRYKFGKIKNSNYNEKEINENSNRIR